jgi:hypothetical protein
MVLLGEEEMVINGGDTQQMKAVDVVVLCAVKVVDL